MPYAMAANSAPRPRASAWEARNACRAPSAAGSRGRRYRPQSPARRPRRARRRARRRSVLRFAPTATVADRKRRAVSNQPPSGKARDRRRARCSTERICTPPVVPSHTTTRDAATAYATRVPAAAMLTVAGSRVVPSTFAVAAGAAARSHTRRSPAASTVSKAAFASGATMTYLTRMRERARLAAAARIEHAQLVRAEKGEVARLGTQEPRVHAGDACDTRQ